MKKRSWTVACLLFFALAAGPARADDAPSQGVDALFDAGVSAFERGDYPAAEKAYEAAWALRQTFDVAGNLGETKLALGKHVEAVRFLERCLATFPVTGDPRHRSHIELALTSAKKHVSFVRIAVDVDGAALRVDNDVVGTAPLAAPVVVTPGTHRVVATLAGRPDAARDVTVSITETVDVALRFEAIETPERPMWPLYVLGGVGVAGLATGVGFLAAGGGSASDAEAAATSIKNAGGSCVQGATNYATDCAALGQMTGDAESQKNLGAAFTVIGGAALLGAGVYWAWPLLTGEDGAVNAQVSWGRVAVEGHF